jgi:hypothetical protein
MTHCLVSHHITGHRVCSCLLLSDLWCVLRLIILPAVKFTLLSTFFTQEIWVLRKSIVNYTRFMAKMWWVTMRDCIQQLGLKHCWSISTGSCLTTLLTALILLRGTTTCLPIWRTGWDHSTSTIIRRWWKVSKHGLAQWFPNFFGSWRPYCIRIFSQSPKSEHRPT